NKQNRFGGMEMTSKLSRATQTSAALWLLASTLFVACSRSQVPSELPSSVGVRAAKAAANESAVQSPADSGSSTEIHDPGSSRVITRTQGEDWPFFLGPRGDSTSKELGIIAPWPKEGLRVVWHRRTGIGYGMPAISAGRLFQFD